MSFNPKVIKGGREQLEKNIVKQLFSPETFDPSLIELLKSKAKLYCVSDQKSHRISTQDPLQ